MPIRVACPVCRSPYSLDDHLAGKKVRCNSCTQVFMVPPAPAARPEAMAVRTVPPPAPAAPRPPEREAVQTQPGRVTLPPERGGPEAPVPRRPERDFRRRGPSRPVLIGAAAAVLLAVSATAFLLLRGGAEEAPQPPAAPPPEAKAPEPKPNIKPPDDLKPPQPKAPRDDFHLAEARKSVVYVKRLVPGLPAASGSGFFVTNDGLIYTNRHVVETNPPLAGVRVVVGVPSAKDPDVLDYFPAAIVHMSGPNDALDFAILKIAARPEYGPFRPLSLSFEKAELGSAVAALGYPVGLKNDAPPLAFNKGHISATLEKIDDRAFYRTDARVNPGNSGGPLLNQRGEAVGIVTLRKAQADNMNYALHLSETRAGAKLAPERLAAAKPEPGPLGAKAVALLTPAGIAPKAAAWDVIAGRVQEHRGMMVVDNNGAPYCIATKEELPENFQMSVKCGVEFFPGGQRLQPSQRTILRCLCVRFGTADVNREILDRNNGYLLQYTVAYAIVFRGGQAVADRQQGNPDEPFLLTVTRKDGEITMAVNGEIALRYNDPNPIWGRSKLSLGGYLSKLYLGEMHVTPLPGGKGVVVGKAEPKKEPAVEPKKGPPKVEPRVVQLPGRAAGLSAGETLIALHLPEQKKLTVFSVHRGEFTVDIPLDEDGVKLAIGQDELAVWLPRARQLRRYNLVTGKLGASAPWPYKGEVTALAMGSRSYGPLLVLGDGDLPLGGGALLDLKTFKPLAVRGKVDLGGYGEARAAPDGNLFAVWASGGDGGRLALRLTPDLQVEAHRQGGIGGPGAYLIPGADGQSLFGHSRRNERGFNCTTGVVFSPEFRVREWGEEKGEDRCLFPSPNWPYYAGWQINRPGAPVEMFVPGENKPFATLDVGLGRKEWDDTSLPFDRRLHLLPHWRQVVTVPAGNDRLLLHPFNFENALEQSGLDYLVVMSAPPRTATRAPGWLYDMQVRSRRGGLKYRVESGPPGMDVDAWGRVRWDVPEDFPGTSADVIVSITDAGGRQVLQPFRLAILPRK